MAIRVGRGKSAVSIDGPLGESLEAELRHILGPVADHLQATADRVLADAQKAWPVRSGQSRDAWTTTLTVVPDSLRVEVSLVNPHTYVRYLKSTRVGRVQDAARLRSPRQALVKGPARRATRDLMADLPAIMGVALEGEGF